MLDRPQADELVSVTCLRYLAGEERISWAVAGHPPPLRLAGFQELSPRRETFPLGAEASLPLRNSEAALSAGDGVVIYTDGATDVRREGKLLGVEGLARLLAPLATMPAAAIAAKVEQAILAWTDEPIRDDLCVLVLKPKNAA